ncbi:DUF5667 domain-containing protein [Nocardioides kribbensis]|uniref:DUF5667 domain-containing protein n=1 Tax=Nocardioides kribbensis TaxID=305517 RepID=UPI0032DB7974
MSTGHRDAFRPARRRAEEFARLVEDASTGRADAARHAELLALVEALRAEPAPEPRPDFVLDLRERLMTAAASELVATRTSPAVVDRLTVAPRHGRRERRLAAAIGGLAVVGATSTMAVAAQSALPGDVLYPLKRAIENAHTGVSVGDDDKGATLLANASGRLAEVDQLSRSGEVEDAAVITRTLDDFAVQAAEAGDLLIGDYAATGREGSITELKDFTATSLADLDALSGLLPEETRGSLVRAGDVLATIDAQVDQLCPTCAGEGITRIPSWLLQAVGRLSDDVLTAGTGPRADSETTRPRQRQQPLGPGSVTVPPQGGQTGPTDVLPSPSPVGGGGGDDGSPSTGGGKDPLTDLLDGDEPVSGPGGGGDVGEDLGEVVDELEDTVGGVVGGAGGVVGGLTDPLTGG